MRDWSQPLVEEEDDEGSELYVDCVMLLNYFNESEETISAMAYAGFCQW